MSHQSKSPYGRLLIAREMLRERYSERLRLCELAAAAGLSEFHFLRAYRAAFGETPHEHFSRLRLEHAKRALARGGAVTEVCFDVGYSSLGSSSSRSRFVRATGQSPRSWQGEVRTLVAVPADLPRLCTFRVVSSRSSSIQFRPRIGGKIREVFIRKCVVSCWSRRE